jgi:hypothetical protein
VAAIDALLVSPHVAKECGVYDMLAEAERRGGGGHGHGSGRAREAAPALTPLAIGARAASGFTTGFTTGTGANSGGREVMVELGLVHCTHCSVEPGGVTATSQPSDHFAVVTQVLLPHLA